MFTVAHSITLALAVFGALTLSSAIVEPLIALSLVAVAVEALASRSTEPSVRRVALVFAFGLLHGLGFAGGLTELNLERSALGWTLAGFNLGVELGQLTVAAVGFGLLALTARQAWHRPRVVVPLGVFIAALGLYWTVERVITA